MAGMSLRMEFRWPEQLLTRVDEVRGFESRSSFVRRAVEEAVVLARDLASGIPMPVAQAGADRELATLPKATVQTWDEHFARPVAVEQASGVTEDAPPTGASEAHARPAPAEQSESRADLFRRMAQNQRGPRADHNV